jgi:imidazolonepropionase-like amidohydrolase
VRGYLAAGLFDGVGMQERPTLLVEGDRIVAVGEPIPESVTTEDLGDATLWPGLVDAHQHLCFDGNGTLEEQVSGIDDGALADRARVMARRALAGGVTTLRDLGDRSWLTLPLRDEPDLPTILAAGPPITLVDGHCWYLGGGCAADDASLRGAVRERAEQGADVVKIMVTGGAGTPGYPLWKSQFDDAQTRLMVDEAHARDLPVAAHCHGFDGVMAAAAAGADTIEHCSFVGPDERPVMDRARIEAVATSGSVFSLTVGILPGSTPPPVLARIMDDLIKVRRWLYDAGAPIVAGTDAGIVPFKPHDVLPFAFADLIKFLDMPAAAAAASVTSVSADACGVGDRKGRLAPGYDADFITTAADPFESGSIDVTAVWKAGNRVTP